MKILLPAALALLAFAAPVVASADTSPLVNRVIVNQTLQQQLQNQLNLQANQLQNAQDLTRANLQLQLQNQQQLMQFLELQQEINLLNARQRAVSSKSHKPPHSSH